MADSSSSSSSSWFASGSDSFVIDDSKPVRQLYPNQFYKICPSAASSTTSPSSSSSSSSSSGRLGSDPTCGDGSEFCFYASRPPQRALNGERLVVELMGGGACWDADTCQQQASYLSMSDTLDDALGRSCQEVQIGMRDSAANMLCGGSLGDTDFTRYNTVIVPYCTQDVHVGSRTMTYNDGSTVYHHGAHNIMSVLQWIYRNFPRLQHVLVTGCSAGGTAVPVVQGLLDRHYNHFASRQLQTASIADSPVYLTPLYFLEHALGRWNPQPLLNQLGLPYQRFASSTEYPTRMWDFILRKGDNRDRWGFISHTTDPISLMYYEYMSGSNANDDDDDDNGGGGGGGGGNDDAAEDDAVNNDDDDDNYGGNRARRHLGRVLDQNDDYQSQWFTELTGSISYIKNKHHNVQSYWIDSEGHCTFGLYYALQEGGSDFDAFAAPIVKEDAMMVRPAVNAFLLSSTLAMGLVMLLLYNRRRRIFHPEDGSAGHETDGVLEAIGITNTTQTPTTPSNFTNFNSNLTVSSTSSSSPRWARWKAKGLAILQKWEAYPTTIGYIACLTVYFWCMIFQQGFAHPMNNPSLGPSAVGLSKFGILNPSLVVYQGQWFRLLTTNFVTSGVITYAIVVFYLVVRTRPLERKLGTNFKSPWLFVTLAVLIATTINAVYCFVPTRFGASCTSLALLMGLQACHLTIYRNAFVRPYLSVAALLFDLLLVSLVFPFNSWIMMLTGILAGPVLASTSKRLDEFLPAGIKLDVGSGNGTKSLESEMENFGQHPTDESHEMSYESMDDRRSSNIVHKQQKKRTKAIFCATLALFVLILVPIIITMAATPRRLYEHSFYTGCKLFYSDDLNNLSSAFFSNDDDEHGHDGGGEGGEHRRRLGLVEEGMAEFFRALADIGRSHQDARRRTERGEGDDLSYSCAQFCVPHLISPLFQIVARNRGFPVQRGQCTEAGYSTHILDKTFSAISYSLDVELYASSSDNDNGGGER